MAIITGGKIIEGALRRVGSVDGNPVGEGIAGGMQIARARYDFAVEGGAIGQVNLSADQLPNGAVVTDGYIDVITPPTSGGAATISVDLNAAGDLIAAGAYNAAPYSTTGRKSLIPTSGATSVKTTAARNIKATIAAAALTGGVFDIVLIYHVTA